MIYKYTILQGVHGVAIFLDADEVINPDLTKEWMQVVDNLYIKLEHPMYFLSDRNAYKYIFRAITELSDEINIRRNSEIIGYHIKSVETNPIHFQEEALYCTMRGWLATFYDIKMPAINAYYNKERRRFEFNI